MLKLVIKMIRKRRKTSLSKLKCPFCLNDNLLIQLDFKERKEKNSAVCIKTAYTSKVFRKPIIRGCGKTFKILLGETDGRRPGPYEKT